MFDFIPEFFWKIIIGLVGAVFQLVNYTYQVFLFLAETNIFDQSIYHNLTDKIYVILGVVMLFVIAYNILTLVIDPDKNEKGATVEKILKNLVTSFIMILLCPSVFNFAFRVQNSILTTNGGIITNFFTDSMKDTGGKDSIKSGGRRMAVNTFKAFFVPVSENYGLGSKSSNRSYKLPDGSVVNCSSSCTLDDAEKAALELGSFAPFSSFAMNIVKEEVEFNWLIALIAGGYLVYVIVSFCFDLAVRACKLAFYQIIAPIAISCRILPNQEDIYSKWLKAVTQTFLSVFIRIIIMNLGVFLISVFVSSDFFNGCADCSFGVKLIGYAFVILGIITFIKQAPKLVDDVFGLGGDISLGIRDKLKDASVFQAGAAIGGGVTSMVQNAAVQRKNYKSAKESYDAATTDAEREKYRREMNQARARMFTSAAGGAASGARHGWQAGSSAGNFHDMAGAAGKGAQQSADARDARKNRHDRYAAEGHNVITGHLADWGADIKDWATGGAEQYEGLIKVCDSFKSKQDEMHSAADKIINKYKSQTALVVDMIGKFKGSNAAELDELFKEFWDVNTGQAKVGLGAIEQAVQSARNIDVATLLDRNSFASDEDYEKALIAKRTEYDQRAANLESMYNQLLKKVRFAVEDGAITGNYVVGDAGDHIDLQARTKEFQEMFKARGNHVNDPTNDKPEITSAGKADEIDDIASAYSHIGAQARAESARMRQQAEARKGDNK